MTPHQKFIEMKKRLKMSPSLLDHYSFAGIELLTINGQQTLLLNMKDRQAINIKILGINYQRIYS
jgi:hypothetical protein